MNEPKKRLILNIEDRSSALWKKLMAHCVERIAAVHMDNEKDSLTAEQTAKNRGRIAELRAFMFLDQEQPKI